LKQASLVALKGLLLVIKTHVKLPEDFSK